MSALKILVSALTCPQCLNSELELFSSNQLGFSCKLNVKCNCCGEIIKSVTTSSKLPDSGVHDINGRVTNAFLSVDKGYSAMESFFMTMNMCCLSKSTFDLQSKTVCKTVNITGLEFLSKARDRVRKHCFEMDPTLSSDCTLNISVVFDGTWHKRGHTSNYGVGCVIELATGLVIDCVVLSKFWKSCVDAERDLGKDSPEYFFWYEGHASRCSKNYDGSSPARETHAAEILWKRSTQYKFPQLLATVIRKFFLI